MNRIEVWGIVASAAFVTYASRAVGILFLADRRIPVLLERALRYVGPAVLAALVASIAAGDGGTAPSIDAAEVAAISMAALIAWWRRNVLWSLVGGLTTFWVVMLLGG